MTFPPMPVTPERSNVSLIAALQFSPARPSESESSASRRIACVRPAAFSSSFSMLTVVISVSAPPSVSIENEAPPVASERTTVNSSSFSNSSSSKILIEISFLLASPSGHSSSPDVSSKSLPATAFWFFVAYLQETAPVVPPTRTTTTVIEPPDSGIEYSLFSHLRVPGAPSLTGGGSATALSFLPPSTDTPSIGVTAAVFGWTALFACRR